MATKIVSGTSTTPYSSSTNTQQTWVESGTGANIFAVQDTAIKAKISLKGTGDVIRIEGVSAEYQVKVSGKTVSLHSETQLITIVLPSATATTTVVFLDGELALTAKLLGTQKLSSAYKDISATPDDTTAATTAAQTYFDDGTTTTAGTGTTFTLTTGADTGSAFTGGSGNDTFNAAEIGAAAAWTVGDAIDGGTGTDVLNITQTAAITKPVGATVTGVETVNALSGGTITLNTATGFTGLTALTSQSVAGATLTAAATTAITETDSALAAGAIAVNGGSTVNSTSTGVTTGTVTIGATTAAAGAVTVNSTTTGAVTHGAIAVTGGTQISVTQAGSNAVNTTSVAGTVAVTGNASTTAITVINTAAATVAADVVGRTNSTVTIVDGNAATASDTLATVTLTNYGASTITSNVLSTLNLTGATLASGTLGLNITAADTSTRATTLNLNLGGGSIGAISGTQAVQYTTVNVATAVATTVADVTLTGATTLNFSGAAVATLTAITDIAAVTALNSTGAGVTIGAALATTTAVTGGTGVETLQIGVTTKAISLGGGNDVLTSTGIVGTGGSVAAGDGTDTIVLTSAQAAVADNDATFNTKFTGFETLRLSNELAAATTLDLAGINAVTTVELAAGSNDAATSILSNMANGGTVKFTAASTNLTVNLANALFNASDVLNLNISNAAINATGLVTAAGVETVNIAAADATTAGGAAVIHTMTLTAAGATSIVVTGNNGLNLTATGSVAVTNFDASGVIGNGTADTAANLGVTYVSVNTTAANAVTIKGGAGNDVLTGAANIDNITGGNGIDIITGGAGNDNIILTETTAAIDKVVFIGGATAAAALAANGKDSITGFGSTDTLNIGTLGDGTTTAAGLTTVSAAAVQAALVDDTVVILNVSGAAASLTTAGTAAVTDFTNVTQVAAFLSERYTTTNDAAQENVIVWNVGTSTYIYHIDTTVADGATSIGATEIVLLGVVTQGAALVAANLVYA